MKPTATLRLFGLIATLTLLASASFADTTDISDGPLANGTSGTVTVKPNVFFIVDDSLSMVDENMPGSQSTNDTKRCWGWYKYNTLMYNPAQTYKPPYNPAGATYGDDVTRYPDASFTAALKDGYVASGATQYNGSTNSATNLSTVSNLTTPSLCYTLAPSGNCASGSVTGRFYYSTYTGTGTVSACNANKDYTLVADSANIAAPGVANGSAAALTNYANWYSYYRKRAYLMKAGTVEAFSTVSDNYRVGLLFMGSVESGSSSGFGTLTNHDLAIADFSGTHRANWFTKVLQGRTGYATPSRAALSRAGRMYAGQVSGWDPVQYSCQQNFTILSTDGYWNNFAETGSYGPKRLDGSTNVGNVDGTATSAVAARATLTVSDTGATVVSSVTVDGVEILDAPTNSSTSSDTVASRIAANITLNGYSATANDNVVTITAPVSAGNLTATPVVTKNLGSKTITATAFSGYTAAGAATARPYLDANNNPNTLADVAYYYYTTDLRTSTLSNCSNTIGETTYNTLCDNNVPGTGRDSNNLQHMTSFTLGLGVSGNMTYRSDYETATSGSYYDITQATANWPAVTNLTCISGCPELIDDVWHAAVNGRGTYYSASDPDSLKSGIQAALSGVTARIGSSAAAATSNLEPVAGDNFVYVALYRTQYWDGDVKAYNIDPDTGAISSTTLWSAQEELDQVISDGTARNIWYFNSGASNKLKAFTYTNLSADGIGASFTNFCTTQSASQCSALTAAQQTLADSGTNLVNYLRGQTTYESDTNETDPLYRGRTHTLGDIVNAVPVYAKKPPFSYDTYDTTYASFKSSNATRGGTVFVAANDGMLHALNAENGIERWAYVPSFVMGDLWRLADTNYGNNHRYYVDGSPTLADICTSLDASSTSDPKPCASSGSWKTILVSGLNKGGCGYYALDVTDPANPKGLWEFTNANLGYTYGNPVVTRRPSDGKWIAIFTSGYNNVPGGCGATGDGNGHVFVVDANTGALLEDIETYTDGTTEAGSPDTPSGLSKLNVWVENADLNVASRAYGGDLLGNVWRIDFDNTVGSSGKEALRLAELAVSSVPQPVTTKPELATVTAGGTTYPVVYVGTGRYLGNTDPSNTNQQSIYALKDKLISTGLGDVRTSSTFVSRTMTQTTDASGQTIRTVSGDDIAWATKDGWYLDLNPSNTSPTERVNVDMQLQFNILTVAGNVPESNVCTVGGYAWLYNIDIDTGKNLATAANSAIGLRLSGNALVAGIKVVRLASGKTVTIVTSTSGEITVEENPSPTGAAAGAARRTMWREIVD